MADEGLDRMTSEHTDGPGFASLGLRPEWIGGLLPGHTVLDQISTPPAVPAVVARRVTSAVSRLGFRLAGLAGFAR
jgi:hypothetical protein